ncbi:TPA: hypothetical protein ACJEU7_002399 [Acinetobacter baumannii]
MNSLALSKSKIIQVGSSVLVENSDGKKIGIVKEIKIDLSQQEVNNGQNFPIHLLLADGEDHWIDVNGNSLDADTFIVTIDKDNPYPHLIQAAVNPEKLLESLETGDFAEFRDGSMLKVEFIAHMPDYLKQSDFIVAVSGREPQTYTTKGWIDDLETDENSCDIIAVHKLA